MGIYVAPIVLGIRVTKNNNVVEDMSFENEGWHIRAFEELTHFFSQNPAVHDYVIETKHCALSTKYYLMSRHYFWRPNRTADWRTLCVADNHVALDDAI